MLNKKAIAAFAAGATLLSGLAFAAPAFAEAAKEAPKTEECEPATAAELLQIQTEIDTDAKSVADAKDTLRSAKHKLVTENGKLAKALRTLNEAKAKDAAQKAKVDAAKKALKDAQDAYVNDYFNGKDKEAHKDKKMSEAIEAFKADAKAGYTKLNKAVTDAETAYFGQGATEDAPTAGTHKDVNTAQAAYDAQKKVVDGQQDTVASADQDLKDAKQDLQAAKDALAAAQCKGEKTDPKKDPDKKDPDKKDPDKKDPDKKDPTLVTPAPSVAQASGALMHTNVAYNEAAADYTTSVSELKYAQAKYDEAKAQLDSLEAQVKAANDNYQNNFVLAGKADTDAGKAAKADLANAVNLRDAYKTHEFKAASDKLAEKKAKLDQAGKKLNAAKAQYSAAYLTALRVEASAVKGFPDPRNLADAPVDVFSPEGKAAAGKLAAAAAQAGKAGAAAAANGAAAAAGANGAKAAAGENGGKKKNNAGEDAKKKLGQTGATVALAAVAASVLAGVGAALRKIRH